MAGGPGIEVKHPVSGVDSGLVRVAVDDDAEAAGGGVQIEEVVVVEDVRDGASGVGGDVSSSIGQLDGIRSGYALGDVAPVGVAADGSDRGDPGEALEDLRIADVTGVDDQIALGQRLQRFVPEQAVGVRDDADGTQGAVLPGCRYVEGEDRLGSLRPGPQHDPIRPRRTDTARMELTFHTLDVFTDRTFGGNPLGVFPDAAHLPTELMQSIAREMNLSESVFLGPPETPGGTARVRIFTPGVEVPFAGHPTVGTAIFLASAMGDTGAGETTLVLEENVGPVPVDVRFENGIPVFARFTTAMLPEHRPSPHSCAELAAMVGLDEADVCTGELGPEMVSCGLPYHIVPVASIDAVRRALLDMSLWGSMVADSWAHHVYLVCMDAEGDGVDVRVRMFAPGSGVPEDPATGSASAALAGYLSRADGREEGSLTWTVEQGLEIGRPSIIHVEADRVGGATSAVRVGGSAVAVSRGAMRVPE